jgi:hypothetical protein
MKVTYYERDLTVGHRDGAYFNVSESVSHGDDKDDNTAYWLTDHKGNRAPEVVYIELDKALCSKVSNSKLWIKTADELPTPFDTVIIYLGEIEETCVGYYDADSGIWFISEGCDEFRMDGEPLYLSPFLVDFWMAMPEKPEYTYKSGLSLVAANDE